MKRILSVLCTVALIATMLSVTGFGQDASASGGTQTMTINVANDGYYGDTWGSATTSADDAMVKKATNHLITRNNTMASTSGDGYITHNSLIFMNFDLTPLHDAIKALESDGTEVVVKSVKLKTMAYKPKDATNIADAQVIFSNIKGYSWTESSTDAQTHAIILSDDNYMGYKSSSTATTNNNILLATSGRAARQHAVCDYNHNDLKIGIDNAKEMVFDITPVYERNMEDPETIDDFTVVAGATFKKFMELYAVSGQPDLVGKISDLAFASRESGRGPQLVIEYGVVEPLAVTSAKQDGMPGDAYEIEFNNVLASAAFKVNGVDVPSENVTVNGKKASFTYDFNVNTLYNVTVTATDNYGGSISGQAFDYATTPYTASGKQNVKTVYKLTRSAATQITSGTTNATYRPEDAAHSDNALLVYRFDVPTVENGYIESATLQVKYNGTNATWSQVFDLGSLQGFNEASATYSDIENVVNNNANRLKSTTALISSNDYYKKADVKGILNDAITSQKESVVFGVGTEKWGGNFYYDATITYTINTDYRISVSNIDKSVSGKTLSKASYTFTTEFETSITDHVALIDDESGAEIEDAQFVYDANNKTISLSSPITLEEEKTYKIVMASGASDSHGNTLSSDLVLDTFSTTTSIEVGGLKVVSSDGATGDFDTEVNLESVAPNENVKSIIKFTNNESENYDFSIYIVSYDINGELIDLRISTISAPQGTAVYDSEFLTVGSSAKKVSAFVWNADGRPLVNACNLEVK